MSFLQNVENVNVIVDETLVDIDSIEEQDHDPELQELLVAEWNLSPAIYAILIQHGFSVEYLKVMDDKSLDDVFSVETYYNPRDAKADKKHPSGLIYDRFHNRNKKKLVQAKSTPGTETIYSKEKTAALNLPEDYISKLTTLKNWLRNNFAPTEEVTQKWKDSLLLRLRSIINEADIDKGNVLSEWPRITDEAGYLLIDSDFDHLYGKSDELFDHWEEFSQNFLKYIRSSEIKDDRSRRLLDILSKPDICQELVVEKVHQVL
ncbi:hypothetical protein RP20_CCG008610 [Aedes albopictus]|nr:hypothetical protein RP20_CCG008610 [Aedes albopictus]